MFDKFMCCSFQLHRQAPTKCRVFLRSAMPFCLLVHPNILLFLVCLVASEQCFSAYRGNSLHKKQMNVPTLGNTSQEAVVSCQTMATSRILLMIEFLRFVTFIVTFKMSFEDFSGRCV